MTLLCKSFLSLKFLWASNFMTLTKSDINERQRSWSRHLLESAIVLEKWKLNFKALKPSQNIFFSYFLFCREICQSQSASSRSLCHQLSSPLCFEKDFPWRTQANCQEVAACSSTDISAGPSLNSGGELAPHGTFITQQCCITWLQFVGTRVENVGQFGWQDNPL